MIEVNHSKLSLARQCELVSIARSSYYYRPKNETEFNLELMRLIDQQYLKTPWYGSLSNCFDFRHSIICVSL